MKTQIIGFFTPWIAYAIMTALHCIIPAKKIKGYVRNDKTGEVLSYRLNGIFVLAASVILWLILGITNLVPLDWLYRVRWESLAGAVAMGLLFSLLIVIPYPSTGKNFLADFFLGRLKNPQFRDGFIDAKMWLYMIGATMLQLNVLSFAAHHWQLYQIINPGFLLSTFLMTWFIWDYNTFERVHLYTYDFIAERTGFKLGFGCLAFYPYFYSVAHWSTVNLPNPGHPLWLTICFVLVFFTGWTLARGANMQKFYFKISPEKSFLGIKPEVLSNGQYTLLVNGFWGRSRHINYLGEILMASGIVLSTGYPAVWTSWLYPLYYVFLLFTRQADDDKICRAKYGELWDAYKKKVKYRIIPYIY
ncbi:MAG: ERG4/ERG24 family protein [Treponema sp.]|nr:ERG4/ERG24 family protein [Treponema sp.]